MATVCVMYVLGTICTTAACFLFFTGNFQPSCGIAFHYKLGLLTISMTLLYMKILGICIWGLILGHALIFRRVIENLQRFPLGVTL